jgi:exodeoxyribonuclease VIII
MVDIETLSSSPRAAVIAIGACVFTLEQEIGSTYEALIHPERAMDVGESSPDTMDWWKRQDIDVRRKMFSGTKLPGTVAAEFAAWVREQRVKEVWANAPTFDCTILRHLFVQTIVPCPWGFRDERCVRTVFAEAKERGFNYSKGYSETNAHDALADARNQARAVILCKRAGQGGLL